MFASNNSWIIRRKYIELRNWRRKKCYFVKWSKVVIEMKVISKFCWKIKSFQIKLLRIEQRRGGTFQVWFSCWVYDWCLCRQDDPVAISAPGYHITAPSLMLCCTMPVVGIVPREVWEDLLHYPSIQQQASKLPSKRWNNNLRNPTDI